MARRIRVPLPLREGIAPSIFRANPDEQGQAVLTVLIARFPALSAALWAERLAQETVLKIDGTPWRAEERLRVSDLVAYYRHVPDEPVLHTGPLAIVHQDEHLLVVDKPAFVPVMPAGRFNQQSLLVRLRAQTGLVDVVPLHRLDRDTAGLVLCAVHPAARDPYTRLFRERTVVKGYECWTPHRPELPDQLVRRSCLVESVPFHRMQEGDGAPNSETRFTRLGLTTTASGDLVARWRAEPVTGRKHQIRVHAWALGMPLLGDRLYPVDDPRPDDPLRPLQLLAQDLRFIDPFSGESRHFQSQQTLQPMRS